MSEFDHDRIARADVRDAMHVALDAARRRLRRVERMLGVGEGRSPGLLGRLRALAFAVVPGGRGRAVARLSRGLASAVEAVERAAAWQQARATYLTLLAERAARARPRREFLGAQERPCLLLGTGGGGTRVLAEAAARLGLFLGATVNESFDSVAWAPLVYDLVTSRADGVDLPRGNGARAQILETARLACDPWLAQGEPFGWKLPEFLLVVPLLFDAFPDAGAVLLVRHPATAALRRPHVTTTPAHPLGRVVLRGAYLAAGRDLARIERDPPHVRQALAWAHQVGRAERWLRDEVPPERVLLLRLEDFALSPRATVARLAAHLGLPPPRPGDASLYDDERAGRRPDPARVREVDAICGEVAARVGYGPGWLDGPVEEPARRALFAGLP